MSNEWKHATLELSKRLVELGVVLETELNWLEYGPDYFLPYKQGGVELVDTKPKQQPNTVIYPAPDVAELGNALPYFVKSEGEIYILTIAKFQNDFSVGYLCRDESPLLICNEDTEAQGKAVALIWLIENSHLKAEDVKL